MLIRDTRTACHHRVVSETEWRVVHGILMTSEAIEAYGGIAFPPALLRRLAEKLDGSDIPFHLDHDLTRPVRIRNIKIFVKDRADGISELRFQAEMHEDDTRFIESRPAMSATVTSPLARDEESPRREDVPLQVSADHAWFSDEVLIGAEGRLIARGVRAETLSVERAYQFAFIPDPQIFVVVVLPFLLSLGAGALWDGIKHLFASRRTPSGADADTPTTVNIEITDGSRTLRAVVSTGNEAVAERAIEALEEVAAAFQDQRLHESVADSGSSKVTSVWDAEHGRWTAPS